MILMSAYSTVAKSKKDIAQPTLSLFPPDDASVKNPQLDSYYPNAYLLGPLLHGCMGLLRGLRILHGLCGGLRRLRWLWWREGRGHLLPDLHLWRVLRRVYGLRLKRTKLYVQEYTAPAFTASRHFYR